MSKKAKIKQHAVAYLVICKLMTREAYDAKDLAHELGLNVITINKHLRELYLLDLIYICGWDRSKHESGDAHQPVPVYRWGNKPDVERPERMERAEVNRRYRERIENARHGQQSTSL
jgi:hypothetical protein